MGMRGKRWIVLLACVAVVCVAIVSAASGHGRGPAARIACAQSATSCQEAGNDTLPPNGYGSQSTDTVPTKSTSGTEFVTPLGNDELAAFDSNWATIVGAFPKLGGIKNVFVRRVLTCAVIAPSVSDTINQQAAEDASEEAIMGAPETDTSRQYVDSSQLFLAICLQMVYRAQQLQANPSAGTAQVGTEPTASTASAGCGQALESLPILIKRSGSAYTAKIGGKARPARKAPLVVSCRKKGLGIQIAMRPRARGRTLRQVIGGHMSIGFSNPTSKPVTFHTVFSFR